MKTEPTTPFEGAGRNSRGIKTRILVCDDELAVRELISAVLGMAGYHVETAASGAEALNRVREQMDRFELVLTDHKMPGLDGLELVRELRLCAFPGKIVVLSGCLDYADTLAYAGLSVDGIMHKPLDLVEFKKAIRNVISSYPGEGMKASETGRAKGDWNGEQWEVLQF